MPAVDEDPSDHRGDVARVDGREPADVRGRRVLVELTAKGRELVDRLVAEDMERQAAWIADLGARERATLARLLDKVLEAVER